MENTLSIQVEQTQNSRLSQVDFNNIPFGRVFSDHMFITEYKNGEWTNSSIKEYGNLEITPALISLHYGQAVFEGMKAYKNSKGETVTDTQWHNVIAWGKTAELIEKYVAKGKEIAVEGKLTNRSYDNKAGEKRYITEIVVNELLLFGK